MQTDQTDPGAALEAFTEGRQSLRLVRLRLALTLIAVAILPLAAVAPIVRSVLDDPRAAQQERLLTQSEHVAAEVRREVAEIEAALDAFASADAAAAALGSEQGSDQAKAAAALLASAVLRPSKVVTAAALIDPAGGVHAVAGPAAFAPAIPSDPGPGTTAWLVRPDPGEGPASVRLSLAIGSPSAEPTGYVVAALSLEALLRWASADLVTAGGQLALLDEAGNPLVVVSTASTAVVGSEMVLEFLGNESSRASGDAPVLVPGLDGLRVIASTPLSVTALPLPALAALVVLLLLLIGAIWWMGRQILAPAVALEAQRAKFEALYEAARQAALRDSLTGLGNHRAFQENVARMVDQARRYGTPFSLVLLDVDEFKRVNDTRGHATGDELLREMGNLIRSTVRVADAGYRIGGDEFALLLPSTDTAGAEILANRLLRRALEDRASGAYQGPISFSAGITSCPEMGQTRLELTAQADAALYRGKRAGRTCVTIFDAGSDRGQVDDGMRAELSAGISAVIESGGLTPAYQPIVHLPTGRILGYEGLVRVGKGSGFAHTGALFDAAEVAGRVLDLDRAALEVVLRGARDLPAETLLSVNVSPRSFEAQEFNAAVFQAILRRHGMAPDRVILELTERDAIRDPDRLRDSIHALQQVGVRVAADDVGAGNAGLRLLSQFRFDVVKIDLSLVQGGASEDQTLSVLTSLVGMARRWGALTIAEGVETAAQLRMIRTLEIDSGQGYLLGRPGPILPVGVIDIDALSVDVGRDGIGAGWSSGALDRRTSGTPDRRAGTSTLLDATGADPRVAPPLSAPPTAASILARGAPSSPGPH